MPELSAEQKIFTESHSRRNLVQALAGSGKTTAILERILHAPEKRYLVLAFNVSAAQDMKRRITELLPENNVCVSTIHSFAFQWLSRREPTLGGRIYTGTDISSLYRQRFPDLVFSDDARENADIWFVITGLFRKFCQSDQEYVEDYFDLCDETIPEYRILQRFAVPEKLIRKTLCRLEDNFIKDMPVEHDMYLKFAAREIRHSPPLPYDEIILDEAQDANACTIDMIVRQKRAVQSFVGDPCQRIYAWRGCGDAFSLPDTNGSQRILFATSFRCPESISFFVRPWLSFFGQYGFTGCPERNVTETTAFIARTRIGYMNALMRLYQMEIPPEDTELFGGVPDFSDIGRFMKKAESEDGFLQWERERAERLELLDVLGLCDIMESSAQKEAKKRETLRAFFDMFTEERKRQYGKNPRKYVVSTAHKAKGAEFDLVCLEDDFLNKKSLFGRRDVEDLRLVYVALTRARSEISVETRNLYRLTFTDLQEIVWRLREGKLCLFDQSTDVSERIRSSLEQYSSTCGTEYAALA